VKKKYQKMRVEPRRGSVFGSRGRERVPKQRMGFPKGQEEKNALKPEGEKVTEALPARKVSPGRAGRKIIRRRADGG